MSKYGSDFEVLLSCEQIDKRIYDMGLQITNDYQGKEVVLVGVLKGAFILMADLVRAIQFSVECDFMRISSYGDQKVSSGNVELLLDVSPEKIKDKHVLIVEDIIDTGNSVIFLQQHLRQYQPASIKLCSLLIKEEKLEHQITVDYLGFKIDNAFVIGYGLDFAEKYRNLPGIFIHP